MPTIYRSWADLPLMLDLGVAACIVGYSFETVRRKCQSGEIRAVKMNGKWRIAKSALMEYCGENGSVWERES